MPETNEEAYATNTKEQYEELGRFVEAFELMVNEVRETCIDLLSKDGDHRDLVRIAFHHQSLSAKPSIEIMRTIVTEVVSNPSSFHHGDKEIFVEVLGKIQGAYEHLSNMRNNLLHGTWFVGFVSEDDPNAETFYLRKYTASAGGFKEIRLPKAAKELRRLRDNCDIVRSWIGVLLFCLQDQTKITDYFEHRDRVWMLVNLYPTPTPLPDKWRPTSP